MDTTLIPRMEKLVECYKELQYKSETRKNIGRMRDPFKFPKRENLLQMKKSNVKLNDIIFCKVNGELLFCKVIKINPSGISVIDLELILSNDYYVEFYETREVNVTHKGALSYSRKIHIIDSNEYVSVS
jgi:hypothetical protein